MSIEQLPKTETKEEIKPQEKVSTNDEKFVKIQDSISKITNSLNNLKGPEGKDSKQFFIEKLNAMNLGVQFNIDGEGKISMQDKTGKLDNVAKLLQNMPGNLDRNNDGTLDNNFAELPQNQNISELLKTPGSLLDTFGEKLTDGSYKIDFKGNKEAEMKIGLADMLDETAKKVKATTDDGTIKEGYRTGLKRGFFDEGGNYIEVLSGYNVMISETYSQEEIATKKQELTQKINDLLQDPELQGLYTENGKENPLRKEKLTDIIKKASEYGKELNPQSIKDILAQFKGQDLATIPLDEIVMNFRIAQNFEKNPNRMTMNGRIGKIIDVANISDPAVREKLSSIENKKMSELNFDEAKTFFLAIFGEGAGTDLFMHYANGNPAMLCRIIATANHEGGLNFGMINRDPNTASNQYNIGTFQISAKFNGADNVISKYFGSMNSALMKIGKPGLDMNNINNIGNGSTVGNYGQKVAEIQQNIISQGISKPQQDLLAWGGYILTQRGGENTMNELANPNLSDGRLAMLISHNIQGGIGAIGQSVVAQVNHQKIGGYFS